MDNRFQMTDEQSSKIGGMIQDKMTEMGYSYRDVEAKTGITVADLFNLANGKRKKFNIFFLDPLCDFLHIDINYFLKILGIDTSGLPKTEILERPNLTDDQSKELERMKGAVLLAIHLNNTTPDNIDKEKLDNILEKMFVKSVLGKKI